MATYTFKFADTDDEFEQIHRLNYRAFVEEIPQHPPNPDRRLVDPFHAQNTYAVGQVGEEIVAMLALRSQRPFSLDRKLADLDQYLPPHGSMCEIRLLYVVPEHRNGRVMRGLMELVGEYGIGRGHDLALISGTTRQVRLYRHMGFVPFGPLVGKGEVLFQPMYLTLAAALQHTPWVRVLQAMQSTAVQANGNGTAARPAQHAVLDPPANFLPGPVNIPEAVLAKMSMPPISHRNPSFLDDVARVKAKLCRLTRAGGVELFFGSGSLANEVVAGQLSLLATKGLMLSNGEFGARLVDQARGWRLAFDVVEELWGKPFDLEAITARLEADPGIGWLWFVHSETSTGMLNDLPGLTRVCRERRVKLCVDCISSIGVVPLDLRDAYLASGTSGKALGSLTGLAFVFYQDAPAPAPNVLPSYVDLGLYAAAQGVPFTLATSLVYALDAALDHFAGRHFAATAACAAWLRERLAELGLTAVAAEAHASPAVTTITLPPGVNSVEVGDALAAQGYRLSYQSSYLVKRNWIQICLMGEYQAELLPDLLEKLTMLVASPEPA